MNNYIYTQGIGTLDENLRKLLVAERETISRDLEQMKKELEDIQGMINRFNANLMHINALLQEDEETEDAESIGTSASNSGGNQLVNTVVKLLEECGEPLHYREIFKRLKERGGVDLTGGDDPANTLLARFYNDPRLYRPKRGTYAIRTGTEHSVGKRKSKSTRRE